jgi:hypothetical protein
MCSRPQSAPISRPERHRARLRGGRFGRNLKRRTLIFLSSPDSSSVVAKGGVIPPVRFLGSRGAANSPLRRQRGCILLSCRRMSETPMAVRDDHVAESQNITSAADRCSVKRSTGSRGSQVVTRFRKSTRKIGAGIVSPTNSEAFVYDALPMFRKDKHH